MFEATLNFPNIETAKAFTSAWAHKTLSGHDMSKVKEDGSVTVKVYNVTEESVNWINNYISSLNS